ncbi:MAG: hypothetical protein K9M49_00775 [Candidatus Marinimicrobia bacterium]|nr:hypothetical protein [Candidatus Neomarinimicrobiota bacterium]MCF7850604.1 hypothetical protein [Candidatus Neomarinimicrobiota bacterium]MCF7903662.1 hypothetical protein [Candidatus Neomarinimicrobiota bacterium]
MKETGLFHSYTRMAVWLLVAYLSIFLTGCSFRPAELTPEEARLLQTRELNGTPDDIAKAAVIVLQDMHYTLDNVDMGMGLITAKRSSERRLTPISRETMNEEEVDQGIKTFFIVAGVIAVVGIILALVFNDSEDDEEDEDDEDSNRGWRARPHHHSQSHVYIGHGNDGPDAYLYTMTIMLEEIVPGQTRVRTTVQGQRREGSRITESGPVQSEAFFTDFYSRLITEVNR